MNPKILLFLSITILLITNSCVYYVGDFTNEELKWVKPFNNNQTIIFISEKDEIDTIVFKKYKRSKETVNHLERGFYTTNHLEIPYEFTKKSYHQFYFDGNMASEQDLVTIEKSSAGFGGMGISFIGLLFDEDGIKKAKKINTKTYRFDRSYSISNSVDVRNGIKNFTFNTDIGIVNYTDERNVKWIRKYKPATNNLTRFGF